MKNSLLLGQYLYSIPASTLMVPATIKKSSVAFTEQLPLMKVAFDFENGSLRLEGDWQFMMAANENNHPSCANFQRDRIFINASIYPAVSLNLNDNETDGLMFPLHGYIKSGDSIGVCSGLLGIEKTWMEFGPQWNINFYLYDESFKDCEIKFTLPVYVDADNGCNN